MPQLTTEDRTKRLNQFRAERLNKPIGSPLTETWWEALGGDWFRLKNYKTLDVIGSVHRVEGFVTRWDAKINQYGYEKSFETPEKAAEWVEEYEK